MAIKCKTNVGKENQSDDVHDQVSERKTGARLTSVRDQVVEAEGALLAH